MPADDFEQFAQATRDGAYRAAMTSSSSVVCLAAPGTPVLYVSPLFTAHTGYTLEDVRGRSLSLLQGPETEPEAVDWFRRLIAARRAGRVAITNYRRDGTMFRHRCDLRPIWSPAGDVTHFVAVQRPA